MKFIIPIFLLITFSKASCFTMPPKVTPVSKWVFSVPNTESTNFKHNTHTCPKGYQTYSQHSNIVYQQTNSKNIINLSIYGYAICCETA